VLKINSYFKKLLENQKPNKSKRYRNWFITIKYKKGNYDNKKYIKKAISEIKDVKYYVYQLEKGPKFGKLHHHLFIRYRNPKTYNKIKKPFCKGHVQHISGPIEQVIKYCTKECDRVEGPVIWGTLPNQGKRTDLIEIQEMIKNGWSNDDIQEIYPVQTFLYHQNINVMRERNIAKN
jgi:hypothetical protein